jgi:hypothetical protein
MNPATTGTALVEREPDAIYQGGKLVGRVIGAEVDTARKEIRFAEIYNSDYLMLPDECEFRQYRILVRTIDDATKVSRDSPQKGRILREVVAEILGYREQ